MNLFHPELVGFFVLFIVFQFKHFVADYPLQTPYMLAKFKESGWVVPLMAHCLVHASLTGIIVAATGIIPVWLIITLMTFDFVVHFIMDRIKASPALLGCYDIKDRRFWWSLGFDQMVHHLTHYVIIYIVFLYFLKTVTP